MATAKKSSKKSSKKVAKRDGGIKLPNGYKTIGRAPNWDHEKNPIIEGERGPAREVTMHEGTKKEYTTKTMTVNDNTIGAVTVWCSAMLEQTFDETDEGDVVRIEFLGYGPSKKGQQPAKLFACAVKE